MERSRIRERLRSRQGATPFGAAQQAGPGGGNDPERQQGAAQAAETGDWNDYIRSLDKPGEYRRSA